MKLSIISFGLALVSLSWAVPAPRSDIEPNSKTVQRARVDDAATIGYATQGGATIGGRGGFTIIVSTQAQLIAAVAIKGSKLIIVNDTIAGDAKVVVGSNTTIVGQTGRGSTFHSGPRKYSKLTHSPLRACQHRLAGIGCAERHHSQLGDRESATKEWSPNLR